MAIKFVKPEVADKYEVVGDVDIKKVGFNHHGPISKVSLAVADKLHASQDPHIKIKTQQSAD